MTNKVLEDLPRVQNSTVLPCVRQREIAAQNSYVDTILDGSEKIYKAPCDFDRGPAVPKGGPVGPAEGGLASGKTGQPKGQLEPDDLREQALPPKPVKPSIDADRARSTG